MLWSMFSIALGAFSKTEHCHCLEHFYFCEIPFEMSHYNFGVDSDNK